MDSGPCNHATGISENPICHVASTHAMCNPKPASNTSLFVAHVSLCLIPIPNASVKVEIKPFQISKVCPTTFSIPGCWSGRAPTMIGFRQCKLVHSPTVAHERDSRAFESSILFSLHGFQFRLCDFVSCLDPFWKIVTEFGIVEQLSVRLYSYRFFP